MIDSKLRSDTALLMSHQDYDFEGRKVRGVVPWGTGGAMAPTDFGRSVNLVSTRDYTHLITTGIPRFSELPTALKSM